MFNTTNQNLKQAASFWDGKRPHPLRTRWWQSLRIVRRVNEWVCGRPLPGISSGFHALLAESKGAPFEKAVSVGCGGARKEIELLRSGVVKSFTFYDISERLILSGREYAASLGLDDRVRFIVGNAMELCLEQDFDLVYWNNALHHMPSAFESIRWSYDRLKPGGFFAMDDYVGPSFFQWSEMDLEAINVFRNSLPEECFKSPYTPDVFLPRELTRPDMDHMIRTDPSEAADSANILPAVAEVFSNSKVIYTGGLIYGFGLVDILANCDETSAILDFSLAMDRALAICGHSPYAIIIQQKTLRQEKIKTESNTSTMETSKVKCIPPVGIPPGGGRLEDQHFCLHGKIIDFSSLTNLIGPYFAQQSTPDAPKLKRSAFFHAERYFMTLSYMAKYNCCEGQILEAGKASFFTYLMKELLDIKNVVHIKTDLRFPVELAPESIDVIICMEVFEHITDINEFHDFRFEGILTMLNSFRNILKPYGKILLTTPNSAGVLTLANILDGKSPMMHPQHVREYTPNELRVIFENSGFDVHLMTTEHVFRKKSPDDMLNLIKTMGYSCENRGDDIVVILKKSTKAPVEAATIIQELLV